MTTLYCRVRLVSDPIHGDYYTPALPASFDGPWSAQMPDDGAKTQNICSVTVCESDEPFVRAKAVIPTKAEQTFIERQFSRVDEMERA